ncbi:MAG: hypothetical protein WC702_00475 [Patescibacteria group bacterium]|jgi:uncharacterized membrane-anchored protein YjiN (DUF445 family)
MREQQFSPSEQANNIEGRIESATEKKEPRRDFESRFNDLARERSIIEHDSEITFQVAQMQMEGLQTLINEYGSDAVFEAIKKQFKSKTGDDTFSTFEVVKALESNPKKRASLFEKMKADAQQEGEKFDRAVNPDLTGEARWNSTPRRYFDSHWGSGQNFVRGVVSGVEAMQALDSFFGRIAPERYYRILSSRVSEFATYVSQFEEEEQKLKGQLAEAGNDIFRLVEDRDETRKERREQLLDRADELSEELTNEIERITNEVKAKLEEWRAKAVGDLSRVGSLETASDEMKTALQKALGEVEAEIASRVKKTEQEIIEQTAALRKVMRGLEELYRS